MWDTGAWRVPHVGHGGVQGATCGTRGRGGCHVWDTGVWRVKRVGHGGVEGVTCGIWGCGGCHMWDTSRATHAAGGNAMSGTLRTLKQDCFPQGVGRHFSQSPKGLEIHVVTNILNILK